VIENARRRRRRGEEVKATIKKGKGKDKAKGKGKKKKKSSDDENESDYDDVMDVYKKVKKLPGQLENCEVCSKRFTVTPYSKTGPEGGLLCTPCGKELAKEAKSETKPKQKGPTGRKRRKIESDRLDGKIQHGAKTLQQLCVEKVARHAGDIDDLGDLPPQVLERLSEIFTKNRVMKPKILDLFLRADVDSITVHDCACELVDSVGFLHANTLYRPRKRRLQEDVRCPATRRKGCSRQRMPIQERHNGIHDGKGHQTPAHPPLRRQPNLRLSLECILPEMRS
jgi:hypothetical protein